MFLSTSECSARCLDFWPSAGPKAAFGPVPTTWNAGGAFKPRFTLALSAAGFGPCDAVSLVLAQFGKLCYI